MGSALSGRCPLPLTRLNRVTLAVEAFGTYEPPLVEIVLSIDGTPLAELVAEYEEEIAADVVGGYRGIIPERVSCHPLSAYFLGQPESQYWRSIGKIALLGCQCGESGCWPLYATVSVGRRVVQWSDFEQPHRRDRDYSGFGPFVFNRRQYEAETEGMSAAINLASQRMPPTERERHI